MGRAFTSFELALEFETGHIDAAAPAMLVWNAQGSRVILVDEGFYQIYQTFPIVARAVLADGTIGPPWRLEDCNGRGTELSSTDARYRLWNTDGSARFGGDEGGDW